MSGGGGGGSSQGQWRPRTQASSDGEDGCDIFELTILSSPVPIVVKSLSEGQVLSVALESQPPQRLVAITEGGDIAGSITSTGMPNIARCIDLGYEYQAIVLKVDGGRVEVRIKKK